MPFPFKSTGAACAIFVHDLWRLETVERKNVGMKVGVVEVVVEMVGRSQDCVKSISIKA